MARSVGGGPSKQMAVAFCLLTVLSVAALAAVGAELALAYRVPIVAAESWQTRRNEQLVTRFYAQVWNGNRAIDADAFIADDHLYHDPTALEVPRGPAGVVQAVGALRRIFPDLVLILDDVVGQRDRVVVRVTAHGTHRGTWLGAEGTERVVTTTGIAVYRIVDRQIAETWVSWDSFGLAMQVGLVLLPVSALGGEAGWEGAPGPVHHGRPH